MKNPKKPKQKVTAAQMERLKRTFEDAFDARLLEEMLRTVYKFGKKNPSTLDMKMLNTTMKELSYSFGVFQPYRNIQKVAVFGSARTRAYQTPYKMAKKFSHLMTKEGWMVITGAADGIMRAGNEGAGRDKSFGLNIQLPFEQASNKFIDGDKKLIDFKYFFTRKLLFLKESHATVLFPGGFGTLDEGFECLTLVQTGKADPRPIVFVEDPKNKFWAPLLRVIRGHFVRDGVISPEDKHLFRVAHTPEQAVEWVCHFYKRYHSMRYVRNTAVLRLKKELSQKQLDYLNKEFKDIVVSGKMVQRGPLREEMREQADEQELNTLPRLVLHFNRGAYGRLIQMIWKMNDME